ncbi:insecticidal delta-endotoxin Cry8Ea1 family protein [Bacillus sp. Fil]|uniref:insecticidal delta-endotoxin Cry8Ea1 family protein n=1 Tax=Bacillus sp. Fil TaxID=3459567 RepID=UPI00403B2E3C
MPNIDQILQALPKDTGAANLKTSLTVVEKAVPNIVKDINQGNINNTAKAIAVYGASLIPYAGVLISPLISLLWPELGGSKTLQQMRKEISDEIDTKITNTFKEYDKVNILALIGPLFEKIQKFEKLINGSVGINYDSTKDVAYSDTSSDIILSPEESEYLSDADVAAIEALSIASDFDKVIANCVKNPPGTSLIADIDIWELPIYVVLATAHLQFLYFVTVNGKGDKIHLPENSLKTYFSDILTEKHIEYRDYIEKTYKKGLDQFQSKMSALANGNNDSQRLEFLNNQIKYYSGSNPHSTDTTTADSYRRKLESYKKLITERDKYIAITINTTIFNMAVPGKWIGNTSNGYFYVSPENSVVHCYRWLNDQNHYYYLDPNNDGKMKIGWFIDLDQQWYYFNPPQSDPNYNSKFAEGEMFANVESIINNTRYSFNPGGSCKNPNSTEVVGTTQSGELILKEGIYRIELRNGRFLAISKNKLDRYHIPYNVVANFPEDRTDLSQQWAVKFDDIKKAYKFVSQDQDHWVLAWNKDEKNYDKMLIAAPNVDNDEHYWIISPATNGHFYIKNYSDPSQIISVYTQSPSYVTIIPNPGTSGIVRFV